MQFDIFETARDHVIAVAHRGTCGGNIPCNTIASYNIALAQGADMIEIDVDKSADGTLMIFHPGLEKPLLGHTGKHIPEMTDAEVAELRYVNDDDVKTQFGVNTLDEVLEEFNDRCYINVDKFWGNPEQIYAAIKRHNMLDQIVVKSEPDEKVFSILADLAPELAYIPIVSRTHPLHERLCKSKINYVGAEVLFDTDNDEVATPEFINMMHKDKKLVWANAIVFNYRVQLSAGHSDDLSLTSSPDDGWGWLAERGFDIVQTDWPIMMIEYLKKTGRYYRK